MKVKLIYRNYKPLHKIYESLVTFPPQGVEYVVPPVKQKLKKLFPIYRKIRYIPLGRKAIRAVEKHAFAKNSGQETADVLQYVNMISDSVPNRPYIVDIEHAASLMSFSPDEKRINNVLEFLQNSNCVAVDCMSQAAKRTLQKLLGDNYASISKKVHVVYPALAPLDKSFKEDNTYIPKKSDTLHLLFVGNQAYVKGFDELLAAIEKTNNKYSPNAITLHAITDDGALIAEKYKLPNVKLYPPRFTKHQIFTQFYMPASAFVMPTKQDTFGMAILDALNCGTAVISTKQFAIPELVSDGVDGMLVKFSKPMMDSVVVPNKEDTASVAKPNINNEIVEGLVEVFEKILEGKINLGEMGQDALSKFMPGKTFSVYTRNKQLLEIYNNIKTT